MENKEDLNMKRFDKYTIGNMAVYFTGLCMVVSAVQKLAFHSMIGQMKNSGIRFVDELGKEVDVKLPPILPKFKK